MSTSGSRARTSSWSTDGINRSVNSNTSGSAQLVERAKLRAADLRVAIQERGKDHGPGAVRVVGRVDDRLRHRGDQLLHVLAMDLGRVADLLGGLLDHLDRDRPAVHIRYHRPGPAASSAPTSTTASAESGGGNLPSHCGSIRRMRSLQRRMRGEQAAQPFGEIHVAGLGRPRIDELRAEHGRADSLQRAGDALGVAGELDRRRIGQKLPLPRHGRLDEIAEQQPEKADHHERQADEQQVGDAVVFVASVPRPP